MIEEKMARYKIDIAIAEKILKNGCSNPEYYEDLIARFKKILRFYEDLNKNQSKNKGNSYPLISNNF